jgi:hypothetical protein
MSPNVEKGRQPLQSELQIANSADEFIPYRYPGFLEESSACYLRYKIKNGRCLVVIAQIPEYFGTDITSGFKEIVRCLSEHLITSGVIKMAATKKSLFQRLRDIINPQRAKESALAVERSASHEYLRNAGWVACYPPGVGLISNESFALVRMDEALNYKFDYRRKEVIADFLGVSQSSLDIDYEKLENVSKALNDRARSETNENHLDNQ